MHEHTVSRRVTRFFAGLMISMGVLTTAAIGLAAVGNASTDANPRTTNSTTTVRGPLIVATPNTYAQPWVPPIHRTVIIPIGSGAE